MRTRAEREWAAWRRLATGETGLSTARAYSLARFLCCRHKAKLGEGDDADRSGGRARLAFLVALPVMKCRMTDPWSNARIPLVKRRPRNVEQPWRECDCQDCWRTRGTR